MKDWIRLAAILSLLVAFLLSPLLFPGNPEISERLMYAFFAACGLGVGEPFVTNSIKALRKAKDG